MHSVEFNICNLNELTDLCLKISNHLKPSMIIGLSGDLGAGKTTLVRCMCQALDSNDWVNSPTYSIIQKYQTPTVDILHVDLYRLTNDCAIDQLDILSQVTSNTIAFIEWIDQTSIIQSNVMITLTIGKESETHRRIKLSSREP